MKYEDGCGFGGCDCRVLFAEGGLCHNSAARVCEGMMCRGFAFFEGMLNPVRATPQ